MPDSVKDLVVRLSFEHGNTKSQIAAIKNEVKLLDSGFQAAAVAAGGFSVGLNEVERKSKLLKQQIGLQELAIDKYGKALEAANNRLKAAQARYQDYTQKLEAAKQKQTELTNSINAHKQSLRDLEAAGQKGSDAYNEQNAELEKLEKELKATNDEIKQWESSLKRASTSIANADKSIQKLTTAQNESKVALGGLQKELDTLGSKAEQNRIKLEKAAASVKQFSDAAKAAGDGQVAVGRSLTKGSALVAAAGVTAAGTAIQWEDAFAGVRKTVSGTDEQLKEIEEALIAMTKVKPAEDTVLSEIAANAGQLGIYTDNIVAFTGVMADLAETTNLTADEGASSFAKFANITGMSQQNFDRLGSTVVELGNNLATTERDIVEMGTNLASAGHQIGLSEAQIMGIGAALSSLGLEAQAGGTAFSRLFVNMQVAAETGGAELEKFADVAGMSAEQFKAAFNQDAAGAIVQFIQGLSTGSQSAIVMLEEMGITETRFRDALLRASNANELFTNAIDMANNAWRENVALTNEANVRYGTTASQLKMAGNRAKAAAVAFGKDLLPYIRDGIDWVSELLEKFNALDAEQRQNILTWAGYAAAIGPGILLIGKANQALGKASGALSNVLSAASSAGGGLGGFGAAVKGLLGPAGIAALAVGLVAGAAAFVDWASGAKAAREAAEDMMDVAREMQETQAQTIYDTGNTDPLARFGLSSESFAGAAQNAESWFSELQKVWSDGEKETDEIVNSFAEGFTEASDGVRDKIEKRGSLLEGLGTLDDDARQKMDEDLKQLDAWDQEVAELLKKRQNGQLSAEDQARLNEVIQLRAELSLEYGGDTKDGFEQILQGMQAEIDRTLASGNEVDLATYGDTLNALAAGQQSYMDALNERYDAQHREIMAIEDETERMAALNALNEQYNQDRLEGEQAYAQAVQEAASAAFQAGGYEEQIAQIDQLAALLSGPDVDLTQLAEWTEGIDEGKMASMLALVEQLQQSGMADSALAELGIDADDLLNKIQQIRDIAGNLEGGEGLATIFGSALPEEVQRILIGLDMTQAAADWAEFMADKDPFTVEGAANIKLNPLDEGAIAEWEAANAGVEVTGPAARVGVTLGADWESDVQAALEAGLLTISDGNGNKLPLTPEVLEKIGPNDLALTEEDGTVHIVITPKLGSTEGLATSEEQIKDKILPISSSTAEDIERVAGAMEGLAHARNLLAEAEQNGGYTESGLSAVEAAGIEASALSDLQMVIADLDATDMEAIGGRIANLMAALTSGELDAEGMAAAQQELQQYLEFISAADTYLGTGNQISAGIAEGMNAYGWSGDAGTLAGSIQTAINSALGIASPATKMLPTGYYAAAGVGEGMKQYNFAADAAGLSQSLLGAFSGLPAQGRQIGSDFGAGLQSGLRSRMQSTLALARSYAAQITATFRSAWQIHSPSKVAENLTDMFGRGLEEGMKDWPRVSERMLDEDIAQARQAVPQNIRTDNRDYSAHSSVTVQKMEVRSEEDVHQVSRELAALVQRKQWARGS